MSTTKRAAKDAAKNPPATKAPKKRPAKPRLVRGEPVVARVLTATVEELARSGYKALRVDDVARSAGVNKTTVYRRWPEKITLVRDALWTIAGEQITLPATGSLRGDMIAFGRMITELSSRPTGQSIIRVLVAEGTDREVAGLKRSMRERHEAIPRAVLAASVQRGELSPDQDNELLFQAFVGALHHRLFFENDVVTDPFIERLVDLLLEGARPRPPKAKAKSRPARRS